MFGTLAVSIDYPHVSRSAGKTFTVPLVRLRGSNYAAHNVLPSPGRPGGTGAEFLQRVLADTETQRTRQVRFDGDADRVIERCVGNCAQVCAADMGDYGTALGAALATMLSESLERVIMDDVLYNFMHYGEPASRSFSEADANASAGFFDECASAASDCRLSGFRRTGQDIQRNVTSSLKQHGPIPVCTNSTAFSIVSYYSLIGGSFLALFSSKMWFSLADNLAQPLSGDATGAFAGMPDRKYRQRSQR
ncbi:S33 family peptidase [Cordyceps militaris]|uniref:S33 family peptidase n=1 Tax=Cordyceps militaris TaxID=73501 RepID=A0A2H4SVE0_CORMI|nr:S33 family peptidase [Cordyceps militaris]